MDTPYKPPKTSEFDATTVAQSKRFFGWAAFVCGLGVVIPPLIGVVGTIRGMVGAFAELDKTGTADPSVLAGDISVALLTTFWGVIFSVISLIPFTVFLVLFFKRRRLLRSLSSDKTNSVPPMSGNQY